ncbi:MAG TPA: CTP--molybdopterin cytidylyltransferase [Gammaproteobacteria bacterium]|nr:CTP--molybdopterin cytidylyltransferase [Gammaproteobacteria bacterium]|tara:strand:- start:38 stop:616 length:579 start_codon:yes stop_codon:yes gene_type:complete
MTGAIVLAAGSSRRFGGDKRRAELADGATVLTQTIHTASNLLDSVLVVLRFGDRSYEEELQQQIDLPNVSYFLAPDSAKGMAHSLANAIYHQSDLDAAMIFLADMPFVQEDTIKALLTAYEANKDSQPIVQPTVNGTPGHPVIFDRAYFREIQELEGDRGARPVVDAHQDKLIRVEVEDQGVIRDVDTPGDL